MTIMNRLIVAAGLIAGAATLSACQTTQQSTSEEMVWMRTDGKRMTGHQKLLAEYKVAATICEGETAKAAANMPPIYWRGLFGAMQAAAVQTENEKTLLTVAKGCMAEHGYILVPKSQLPKG